MLLASFVVFILLIVGFGYISKRWIQTGSDFVVASRGIGFGLSFFGVVAIGVAGTMVALCSGYSITFGAIGGQVPGWAWCLVGLLLYAAYFGAYARRSGTQTLPEYLEMRFDTRTRVAGSIVSILGMLSITAVNIVGIANICAGFTGWNFDYVLLVVFATFVGFVLMGGIWAVTTTDFIQMLIALFFIPALGIWLITHFGGVDYLSANWPGPTSFWTSGIAGVKMPVLSPVFPSWLTWTLQFAFLTFGTSYYWMRMASSRTEKIAQRAYYWGIIPILIVIFPILGMVGLYAAASNPTLFAPIGQLPEASAFGVILKVAPEWLAAGTLMAVIAAGISTGATAYIGAIGIGIRDVVLRFIKPDASAKEQLYYSRLLTIIMGLIILAFCYFPGGFYGIVGASFVWLLPIGVLVWFAGYSTRTTSSAAFWGLVISALIMLIATILQIWGIYNINLTAHLSIIGGIICLLIYSIGSLFGKPKYYGEADFLKKASIEGGKTTEKITLSKDEVEILKNIHDGFKDMAQLCDLYGKDSSDVNRIIEKLDEAAFIKRKAYTGADFFTFELTPKGMVALPESNEQDKKLRQYGLSTKTLDFLIAVRKDPGSLNEYSKETGQTGLTLSAYIRQAADNGYIDETGFWQRKISITDKGLEVLKTLGY